MAMPRLVLFKPKMPVIIPAMASGAPQIGRHQAMSVIRPSTSEAIAKPGRLAVEGGGGEVIGSYVMGFDLR